MMRRLPRLRIALPCVVAALAAALPAVTPAQPPAVLTAPAAVPDAPPAAPDAPAAARTDEPQTINLSVVLRLAGLNNLDLALVREAEHQAAAANDAATVGFFPWLSVGAAYAKHTGAAQDVSGNILDVDTQLYQRSASLNAELDLGDAIFQKLAARQAQSAAGYNVEVQRNDTALAAASAYFDLVNAVAAEDIAREAVRISQDYEQQLDRAFNIGLTNRSDVLRVSVQTQREQVLVRQAQAQVRAAAAALATELRLDASVALEPAERIVAPPALVSLDTSVADLVNNALSARPELKGSAASIAAAEQRQHAAKYGPLIPSLGARALEGQLRGGPNGYLSDYTTSHDYIVGLNWRLGPNGLFDFSRTEAADSQLRQQRLSDEKLRDTISQQVVDAFEAARAGLDEIGLSRRGLALAEQSLKLSEQRREFGVSAVLEVIQAQQSLTQARTDYAEALTRYAKAQYALAHATARINQ
ncbi:MAG: TolC family protein [Steroidobacterales bacterium]